MTFLRFFLLALGALIAGGVGSGTNEIAAVAAVLFFPLALALYFLPSIEGWLADHPSMGALLALNLFLGWTLLGWVAALVWALKKPSRTVFIAQESPNSSAAIASQFRRDYSTKPTASEVKICPHCAEEVRVAALKCKHCGSELTPASP